MRFKQLEMTKAAREFGSKLPPLDLIQTMLGGLAGKDVSSEDYHKGDVYMGCATVAKWYREKRPYYRLYPGVMETLLRLDIDKLLQVENMNFPFGLETLEIEFPEPCWEVLGLYNCVVRALDDNYYGVTVGYTDNGYGFFPLNRKNFKNDREDDPRVKILGQTLFGILAIGDDPEIIKPVVLQADTQKYVDTQDAKYVEKARRRGVIGFEVGPDIPTREEARQQMQENELAKKKGQKCPHKRCAYLGWRWTGHRGSQIPKLTWISEAYINWNKVEELPQGYYGKEDKH